MSTVSFSQLAASKCAPLSGAEKASPLCLVEKIENNGSEKGLEACGFRCGIFLYIYPSYLGKVRKRQMSMLCIARES